jgi:hypothetical protein
LQHLRHNALDAPATRSPSAATAGGNRGPGRSLASLGAAASCKHGRTLTLLALVVPLGLDSFAAAAALGNRWPTAAQRWRAGALPAQRHPADPLRVDHRRVPRAAFGIRRAGRDPAAAHPLLHRRARARPSGSMCQPPARPRPAAPWPPAPPPHGHHPDPATPPSDRASAPITAATPAHPYAGRSPRTSPPAAPRFPQPYPDPIPRSDTTIQGKDQGTYGLVADTPFCVPFLGLAS